MRHWIRASAASSTVSPKAPAGQWRRLDRRPDRGHPCKVPHLSARSFAMQSGKDRMGPLRPREIDAVAAFATLQQTLTEAFAGRPVCCLRRPPPRCPDSFCFLAAPEGRPGASRLGAQGIELQNRPPTAPQSGRAKTKDRTNPRPTEPAHPPRTASSFSTPRCATASSRPALP